MLPKGLAYLDELGQSLQENPPPKADACAVKAFRAVGIGAGRTPSTEATGAVRKALTAAVRRGPGLVTSAVLHVNEYSRGRNNGWVVSKTYIGDYGRNYLGRAVIARFALGANTAPETVYPSAFTDSRGRAFSGRHSYRLRFRRGQLPPADAFWSLTMYTQAGYLHPNPDRIYAVGDRTKGLRKGSDGSLTITISRKRPKGAAAANWLPAPAGRFRVLMRIYEPRRSALERPLEAAARHAEPLATAVSQENVEVVREVMRAFNARDDSAMSHYAEDAEFRLIGGFSGMAGENLRGREAILRFAWELIDNLQARFVVERLFEADDRVVLIASAVGAGDASGAGVEWRWGQVYRFRDGLITEVDNYWEAEEALEALGGAQPDR